MKKIISLFVAIITVITLCSCGSTDNIGDSTESNTNSTVAITTESTETVPLDTIPQETESTITGYSLEEISGTNGLFCILEDGSFARYYVGGFKQQIAESLYTEGNVLYIHTVNVERNPILTSNDTIAIFNDQNIHVKLYPVAAAGTTASFVANDESVLLDPIRDIVKRDAIYCPIITLNDNDQDFLQVINSTDEHLFGAPAEEIVCTEYDEAKGKIITDEWYFRSYPRESELTITYVTGTKAIQEKGIINYNYYVYGDYFNAYDPNASWPDVKITPTVDGYAALSLENVPAGQYVMIVSRDDNSYYGTVVTIE